MIVYENNYHISDDIKACFFFKECFILLKNVYLYKTNDVSFIHAGKRMDVPNAVVSSTRPRRSWSRVESTTAGRRLRSRVESTTAGRRLWSRVASTTAGRMRSRVG